jgi:ADP-ribose pyrophosphatase
MLEPDEAPLDCARRELEEETGYVAERWSHVATLLPTPGIAGVTMVYFLAEALSRTGRQALDPTECLSVKRVPLEGVIDRLVHGRAVPGVPDIVDGKTHMAVFYLGARTMGSRR